MEDKEKVKKVNVFTYPEDITIVNNNSSFLSDGENVGMHEIFSIRRSLILNQLSDGIPTSKDSISVLNTLLTSQEKHIMGLSSLRLRSDESENDKLTNASLVDIVRITAENAAKFNNVTPITTRALPENKVISTSDIIDGELDEGEVVLDPSDYIDVKE